MLAKEILFRQWGLCALAVPLRAESTVLLRQSLSLNVKHAMALFCMAFDSFNRALALFVRQVARRLV